MLRFNLLLLSLLFSYVLAQIDISCRKKPVIKLFGFDVNKMSFAAPEWDEDVLGDQTHSNLFQKNTSKIFPKQKSKKKKQTPTGNNNAKFPKQIEDNVSRSTNPTKNQLKKKLKRLNSDNDQKADKPEANNIKQVTKEDTGKTIITSSRKNGNQNKNNVHPKKDVRDSLTEKQSNKKLKKKLKRLQKDNSNIAIQVNDEDNENKETGKNKKLKKQKESNVKQNGYTEMKKPDKREKKKKLQNEKSSNNNITQDDELENANEEKKITKIKDAETRERRKMKKKLKRLQKQQNRRENSEKQGNSKFGINVDALKQQLAVSTKTESKSTSSTNTLREKMVEKLKSARFRFINEQMYTNEGKDAQKLFKSDPAAFKAYHEGYRQQISKWPLNPLDTIIKKINKLPKDCVVADFGCGDARLAKSVPQKVHSFDLVSSDPSVIACDMAHVPLKNSSVDVAVFCLSLMGTNLKDYLYEANRVLKIGGTIQVAEVESRFDKIEVFIEGIQRYGFVNTWKDLSHNLFYFLDFKKERDIKYKNKLPTISLHPCLYKKR